MDAAPAAIPVNPKTAAISAITKKVNVQRSILRCFGYAVRKTNSVPPVRRDMAVPALQKPLFRVVYALMRTLKP